jgi:hypothetical protein
MMAGLVKRQRRERAQSGFSFSRLIDTRRLRLAASGSAQLPTERSGVTVETVPFCGRLGQSVG